MWHTLFYIWTWIVPFMLFYMGGVAALRVFWHWSEQSKWNKALFTFSLIYIPLGILYLATNIYLAVNLGFIRSRY